MVGGKLAFRLSWILLVVVWVALLAYLLLNAVRRVGGPTGDFVHFYEAARAMVQGQDIYSSGRGGYIYPPLLAFLYTPVAGLPPAPAAAVLLVCNMGLLLLSAFVGARELAGRFGVAADPRTLCTVALAAMLLTADKAKGELQMWQTNVLLLFLFTAALRLLDRRPALAGAALGMAFNIKFLPIVLLPYLLLRRRWAAAGAFVASAVGFALLPAVLTGWDVNLRYQAAAYSGLLRLMGVPVGAARAANIENISAGFSVSIPSAIARLTGAGGFTGVALPAAGLVALAAVAAAGWMYRRHGVPFLYRPDDGGAYDPTTRAIVGLEWACLLTAVLVFSPQTNTRHLCLLLFTQTLAALLLLCPRPGVRRLPLLIGTAVLVLGLVLPFGGEDTLQDVGIWCAGPLAFWHMVGGPCWCALGMLGTLLWVGLRYARSLAPAPVMAAPTMRPHLPPAFARQASCGG